LRRNGVKMDEVAVLRNGTAFRWRGNERGVSSSEAKA